MGRVAIESGVMHIKITPVESLNQWY